MFNMVHIHVQVTKYINGHTDVCMGVICTNDKELSEKLRFLQLGKIRK